MIAEDHRTAVQSGVEWRQWVGVGGAELTSSLRADRRNARQRILDAYRKRRLRVRVLTDDSKVQDLGSDVEELDRSGISVAVDHGPQHMHHKFAIFDSRWLATGSFNWTRSATINNHENLIVTDDPRLADAFQGEFDKLWERYTR